MTIHFRLLSLALAALVTGCSIVPHYATAKLARKGELQVTPAVTVHTFNSTGLTNDEDDEDLEASGSGVSVGAAGAYGINDALNVAVRYEYFLGHAESPHFVHGELKFGIEPDEVALSIGYGQLLGTGLHQATLNAFLDYPLEEGFVFCLSPQGSILFVSDGPVGAFDATMNGSLAWAATPQLTMIPQIGVAIMPLFFSTFAVKVGFAGRYTF